MSNLCQTGQQISRQCNDIAVMKNGDPTPLYWHIVHCDDCEQVRLKEIVQSVSKLKSEGT